MSEVEMTEEDLKALIKKANNLLLFTKDESQIFILGTIHHYHLVETNDYSYAHIQSAIQSIAPDVLLIEARPETIEKYNAVDGPLEMVFARCYACNHGISVKGIDWWYAAKNNKALEALEARREDKLLDNILSESAGYIKALVLFGASHRERIPELILKEGYEKVEIDCIDKYFDNISIPFVYPKGMAEEYSRQVKYYESNFMDEINNNMAPDDELYDHWKSCTEPNEPSRQRILEMIAENRLFKSIVAVYGKSCEQEIETTKN